MANTTVAKRDPAIAQFLQALDHQRRAHNWLENNNNGLARFVRALDGGPRARTKLRQLTQSEWDEVLEVIGDDALNQELLDRHSEVHLLFEAVRGDEKAMELLKKHRPAFYSVAQIVREANEQAVATTNGKLVSEHIEHSAAADVGCLIGELHLSRGEYHKAVAAFTRAIDNEPTPDVYEGRARAYRALAEEDERRAQR